MHLLGFFYRLSPLRMVLATIAGAASGVVNVLFIATLTEFLRSRAGVSGVWRFFLFCALIIVARVASEWTLIALSQDLVHRLRLELCRKILQVPLRRLETLGSHPLLATLTEDINAITQAALAFPMLCTSAAVATGFLIYIASLSLLAFATVIVVVSTGVGVYKAIARRAAVHVQLGRERTDTLMRHYRTLVHGSKELKLNVDRRRRLLAGLTDTASAVRQHVKDATIRYTGASVTTQALYFLLIASLAIALPLVGLAGGGVLTGVVLALLSMRGSVESIVGVTPALMRAEVSLRKIQQLGMSLADAAAADEADEAPRHEPRATFSSIELRDVAYAYRAEDGTAFALGPMNLRVRAGEVVFIAGGNGSGKTTLAKLLTGLYVPEAGEVRLDGKTVTDETREHYRGNFSAIFADFHLESELPGPATPAADQRARELLGHLRLSHKVSVEGGRLSTVDLSQGQRKRLALLVALLEDRSICLFDEWAADQDSTFRRFFYREILPGLKARGKTLLVVSHDEQFYDAADRVIYLEEGRIRQDGPPEDGATPRLPWAATGTTGRAASLAGAL